MLPLGEVMLQSACFDHLGKISHQNFFGKILYILFLYYLPVSFLVKLHPEEDVLPDSAAEHPGLLGRVGDVPGDGHTALTAGELPQHRLNDGALA